MGGFDTSSVSCSFNLKNKGWILKENGRVTLGNRGVKNNQPKNKEPFSFIFSLCISLFCCFVVQCVVYKTRCKEIQLKSKSLPVEA